MERQFIRKMNNLRELLRRQGPSRLTFGAGYGSAQSLQAGGVSTGYNGNLNSGNWAKFIDHRGGPAKNAYLVIDDGSMGGHLRMTSPDGWHLLQVRSYPHGEDLHLVDISCKAKWIADFSSVSTSLLGRTKQEDNVVIHQLNIRGNSHHLAGLVKLQLDLLSRMVSSSLGSFPA